MDAFILDELLPIVYNEVFREYGIRYSDGSHSYQVIRYCPWDGARLPKPLRDEWFDRLDELGLEPEDPAVPEEMRTGSWWQQSPGR
jgi:hypothetical protein